MLYRCIHCIYQTRDLELVERHQRKYRHMMFPVEEV